MRFKSSTRTGAEQRLARPVLYQPPISAVFTDGGAP